MPNLYQEVPTNYSGNEHTISGLVNPNNIKPADVSISSQISITKDINELIRYMETLLSGKGKSNLDNILPKHTLTLQTLLNDNIESSESHYAPLFDTYVFSDLREYFEMDNDVFLLPDDPLAQLYLASISVLGLFILYRLMSKS